MVDTLLVRHCITLMPLSDFQPSTMVELGGAGDAQREGVFG